MVGRVYGVRRGAAVEGDDGLQKSGAESGCQMSIQTEELRAKKVSESIGDQTCSS